MRSTTAATAANLRSSHNIIVSVSIYLVDGVAMVLDAVDGSITVTRTGAVSRTLNLTIPDPDAEWVPTSILSPLGIFSGSFIAVDYAVYNPPDLESFAQGIFYTSDLTISHDEEGISLQLVAEDISGVLSRTPFKRPFDVASGEDAMAAVARLLAEYISNVTDLDSTGFTLPSLGLGVGQEVDVWRECVQIAEASGVDLVVDWRGTITTKDIKDPASNDYSLLIDSGGILLPPLSRNANSRGAYNGVRLTYSGSGLYTPIYAESWEDNLDKPMFRGGYYGENPKDINNSRGTSQVQCTTAAARLFNGYAGTLIEAQMIPNPALEAGDVVRLTDDAMSVDITGVVDTFTLPLKADRAMSVTIRTRDLA